MYRPQRDHRFEYVHDAIHFIEQYQCGACVFRRTDDEEYPMCFEVSGTFYLEEPMEEIDDLGNDGLTCKKYKPGDPTPDQVIGQESLF